MRGSGRRWADVPMLRRARGREALSSGPVGRSGPLQFTRARRWGRRPLGCRAETLRQAEGNGEPRLRVRKRVRNQSLRRRASLGDHLPDQSLPPARWSAPARGAGSAGCGRSGSRRPDGGRELLWSRESRSAHPGERILLGCLRRGHLDRIQDAEGGGLGLAAQRRALPHPALARVPVHRSGGGRSPGRRLCERRGHLDRRPCPSLWVGGAVAPLGTRRPLPVLSGSGSGRGPARVPAPQLKGSCGVR